MLALGQLAVLLAAVVLLPAAAQDAQQPHNMYDPVADPEAVVLCSASTRLTLLSPLLVRAEHHAASQFEDRASLAFVNRRLPVPAHTVRNTSAWCNITLTDSDITVSYSKLAPDPEGSALLSGGLQVRTATGAVMWAGLDAVRASANLGGTVYDLKGQNGSLCGEEMMGMEICAKGSHIDLTCGGNQKTFGDGASYCTHGVLATLSEQGTPTATLYDDSENTVREPDTNGGWWASRQGGTGKDLYLFLHGIDHRAGLRTLASVSGHAAIPPRRFFGVWWSRWNKYTTQELHDSECARVEKTSRLLSRCVALDLRLTTPLSAVSQWQQHTNPTVYRSVRVLPLASPLCPQLNPLTGCVLCSFRSLLLRVLRRRHQLGHRVAQESEGIPRRKQGELVQRCVRLVCCSHTHRTFCLDVCLS
jgi:hypothetical protein